MVLRKIASLVFFLPMIALATAISLSEFSDSEHMQAGPKLVREIAYSYWKLSCAVANNTSGLPEERCMISQLISTDPLGRKTVLGITVDFIDPSNTPTIRFRFSSEATKTTGVGIKVDNYPEMRLAINNCNAKRCEAIGRLSPDVLKYWRQGKMSQLAFMAPTGKQISIRVPLSGFDAAFSSLIYMSKGQRMTK